MTAIPFLDLSAMNREVDDVVNQAWDEIRQTNAFIGGAMAERFEEEWARYCGTTHAVGVANGTDALQLVLRALNVGPGDEVIIPTNTFVATAEAVALVGGTPRFVDVDDRTLLVTADAIRSALTPRTVAVIPVHLFGQMPDMDAIAKVTSDAGVALIEDAAQAQGAAWRSQHPGTWGAAACFSFYPGKNLGAFGDAGAVVTNDATLADTVRSLGNHGRTSSHHLHPLPGTNSRLDGLQAAVLSAKLPLLDDWNTARRNAMSRYRELLGPAGIRLVEEESDSRGVYHLAVARVPSRDQVKSELESNGIGTGIHYPVPCHLQTPFLEEDGPSFPVAEAAAGEILSLPMGPHLSDEDIQTVCERLVDAVEQQR